MTTYNTRNKLGSTAVKDLYDNAENLDVAVNDRQNKTWFDRFNFERLTWAGIIAAGTGDASVAVEASDSALLSKSAAIQAKDTALSAASSAGGYASNSLFYSQESERFANAASVAASASSGIWRPTLTTLNLVTNQPVNTMGVVYANANSSLNGWYIWDGSAWNKTDLQPAQKSDFGEYNPSATEAINWDSIIKSGIYKVAVDGKTYIVEHINENTATYRMYQTRYEYTPNSLKIAYRYKRPGVSQKWTEWEEISSTNYVDNKTLQLINDVNIIDYEAYNESDEVVSPSTTFSLTFGRAIASPTSLLYRKLLKFNEGPMVLSLQVFGSPNPVDIDIELYEFDGSGINNVKSHIIGKLEQGVRQQGSFVLNANGELNDIPQAKIYIRSADDQSRIVLTDLKINKFTTPYWYSEESNEYGFEMTPQSLRENKYLETYIVAPNVTLSDRNNYYMTADYIQRKPGVNSNLALYSNKPIIKNGFSTQFTLSVDDDVPGVIFTQTVAGGAGRVQIFVNRNEKAYPTPGYLYIFIEGTANAVGLPFNIGEKFSFRLDVIDNIVSVYSGNNLVELMDAKNGILDRRSGILGGEGIIPSLSTKLYSIKSLPLDMKIENEKSAIPSDYKAPQISGKYKFVFDGEVNDEFESADRVSPASLVKVMTAILVLEEETNLDRTVSVIADDISSGSGNNLQAQDHISISDLLHNLMLASSNTAANTLARTYGNFIQKMNDKAALLGMADTVFTNASGLASSTQRTTASDMIKLCQYASNNAVLNSIWSKKTHTITVAGSNARAIEVDNSNEILGDLGVIGGKTGSLYPDVFNLMVFAEIDGVKFYGVVLGSLTNGDRYALMRNAILKARMS